MRDPRNGIQSGYHTVQLETYITHSICSKKSNWYTLAESHYRHIIAEHFNYRLPILYSPPTARSVHNNAILHITLNHYWLRHCRILCSVKSSICRLDNIAEISQLTSCYNKNHNMYFPSVFSPQFPPNQGYPVFFGILCQWQKSMLLIASEKCRKIRTQKVAQRDVTIWCIACDVTYV